MGSTNFLPFNPTQANQENDAAYLADATRTGGAGVDAIWPSQSANKTLYQVAGGMYALMAMMANKGFTALDTNLATLTAVLANLLTTADVPAGLQVVPYATSMAFNAGKYAGFQVTLTGNPRFTIAGQAPGAVIGLIWLQDSVGGRAVTFPGNVNGGAQPDPTANVATAQLFKVDSAGNLDAVGPAVSVNGLSGLPIGAVNPSSGVFTSLKGPTVAGTDNSTNAATTAWVRQLFAGNTSFLGNGYIILPGGLILQWGTGSAEGPGTRDVPVSFPIAFPNACFVVVITAQWNTGQNSSIAQVEQGSITTAVFEFGVASAGSVNGTTTPMWFAVGY